MPNSAAKRLQFAVLVAVARLAFAVVLREQQFDHRSPRLADPPGVGQHFHPLAGRHGAGSDEVSRPFDLDHAYAAGPDRLQPFHEAQRGDADAGLLRGGQDRGAFGNFDGNVVDRKVIMEFFSCQSLVVRSVPHLFNGRPTRPLLPAWTPGLN